MATYTDNFTGTATTDLNGQTFSGGSATWARVLGTMVYVALGGAKGGSVNTDNIYVMATVAPAERMQQIDIAVIGSGTTLLPRFGLNYNTATNDRYEVLYDGSTIYLTKIVNGGNEYQISTALAALTGHTIRVKRTDTLAGVATITVVFDPAGANTTLLTKTDNSPFSVPGQPYIGSYSTAGTALVFSQFVYTDVAPPTGSSVTATGKVNLIGAGIAVPINLAGARPSNDSYNALTDGDFDSIFTSVYASNGWAGVDAGNGNTLTPTSVLIAARQPKYSGTSQLDPEDRTNTATNWEDNISGALIQGSNDVTLASWTTLATLGAQFVTFYPGGMYTNVPIVGASAYRFFRLKNSTNGCSFAEFQIVGTLGGSVTSLCRPCRPTATPAGGSFASTFSVTLASETTNAAIYYTKDGTTPTSGSTLYSGAITLTTADMTSGAMTLKAIAIENGVSSLVLSTKFFIPAAFRPGQDCIDNLGNVVYAMSMQVTYDSVNGLYRVIGQNTNRLTDVTFSRDYFASGENGYTTPDMLTNWTPLGIVSPAINETTGVNQGRPRVILNPNDDKFYLFEQFNPVSATNKITIKKTSTTRALGATASGPFSVSVGNFDTSWGVGDNWPFVDTDNTIYLCHSTGNQTGSNSVNYGHNGARIAVPLLADCTGVDTSKYDGGTNPYILDTTAGTDWEAPVVFVRNGIYYLIQSENNGYNSNQGNNNPSYKCLAGASLAAVCAAATSPRMNTTSLSSLIFNVNGATPPQPTTAITDTSSIPAAYPGNFMNAQTTGLIPFANFNDTDGQQAYAIVLDWWSGANVTSPAYLGTMRKSRFSILPILFSGGGLVLKAPSLSSWTPRDYFTYTGPAPTPGSLSFSNVTGTALRVTTGVASGSVSPYVYEYERAPDVAGSPGSYSSLTGDVSSLFFDDSGLSPGTTYWYRVRVTDGVAATAYSSDFSVTTAAALTLNLTETFSLSDSRAGGENKSLTQALSLTDTRVNSAGKGLIESLSLTDSRVSAAGKALVESLSLSDTHVFAAAKNLAETLFLTDAVIVQGPAGPTLIKVTITGAGIMNPITFSGGVG